MPESESRTPDIVGWSLDQEVVRRSVDQVGYELTPVVNNSPLLVGVFAIPIAIIVIVLSFVVLGRRSAVGIAAVVLPSVLTVFGVACGFYFGLDRHTDVKVRPVRRRSRHLGGQTGRQQSGGEELAYVDLFARAVEQLGSERIVSRLGGVYTMELVGTKYTVVSPAIRDLLSAFVRVRPSYDIGTDEGGFPADIQAAMTVLGRLPDGPSHIDLRSADLRHADLRRLDFSSADFSRTELQGSALDGSRFAGANLREADLSDITAIDTNFSGSILAGSDLSRAQLGSANLTGALLGGARLTNVFAARASFAGALLAEADLSNADLREANFSNAYLDGADLTGANVTGANFRGARLDGAIVESVVGLNPASDLSTDTWN